MKIQQKISLIAILLITFLWSCSSDDPNAKEIAFEKLEGDWSLDESGIIELDGTDISLNYSDFSLSFADGTYETINGGDLFNASGTWEWIGDDGTTLLLDTGEGVSILTLTESVFRFSFFHQGSTRTGLRGSYIVQVGK
ncbi:hypothetical protein [Roseivirga misakiensis]|uniref:Lipocalin-like domain-containing protein n=1 Tax=Roseivirga misakiensis TaxID=1563681 RepID=A0A1E5SLL6_9BACT|nr:hypothetical protein [Roseivirga misakiensis]OEJ99946.1 hypothetical protein BFP71_10400 [Roseivirga misakiensis]